jgi:hypothetical protein
MALFMPVFYGVVGKDCKTRALHTWDDAVCLFKEPDDPKNLAEVGIRVATSRNWWYQELLGRICRGTRIIAIEFATVAEAWSCICEDELQAAQRAAKQIMDLLGSNIPHLGEWEDESVEDLRQNLSAFQQAEVSFDIGLGDSWGFEATKDFCSFVKTLYFTMAEALERNECFLYIVIPS